MAMFTTACVIEEVEPTWELEKYGYGGFLRHSVETFGFDGDVNSFAYVVKEEGKTLGVILAKTFYGALHIKQLFLEKKLRGKGYGTRLMDKAMKRGKELGCSFVHLETMNFQALEFYRKLGFILEYTREGYHQGVSMHYLRKPL